MTRRQQPAGVRAELVNRLRSAQQRQADSSTIRAIVEEIELIDRTRLLVLPKESAWVFPLAAAIIIALILSISLIVRAPLAAVELDAETTSFLLAFAGEPVLSKESIAVREGGIQIDGDYELDRRNVPIEPPGSQVQSIGDMKLSSEALVRIRQASGSTSLKLEKGGLAATVSYAPSSTDANPLPKQLVMNAGAALIFPKNASFILEAMDVKALTLSEVHRVDAAPHIAHLPSILKGTLSIPVADQRIALDPGRRFQLAHLSDARCFIRADEKLRLACSGNSRIAQEFGLYGPELSEEANLMPPLFDVAMSWPLLASILAAISALYAVLLRLKSLWRSQ